MQRRATWNLSLPDPSEITVIMWRPRADEHALAASLGMCEQDPELLQQMIAAAQQQTARDLPGARVRVYRWHIWRVVRTMARLRLRNTPEDRAIAYDALATDAAEFSQDD